MPFATKALEHFTNNLKDYDGNYLEIGVFNGDSIASLGDIYPNKKIYGVDPFIEDGNTSHATSKGVGEILIHQKESTLNLIKDKSNVVLFEMTSKRFFEELNNKKIKELNINAVFIDGDHHYEHVKNDVELTLDLIGNKKGLVIFDDTRLEDVQKAMNDFEQVLGSRITNKEYIDCCYMLYTIKEIHETT